MVDASSDVSRGTHLHRIVDPSSVVSHGTQLHRIVDPSSVVSHGTQLPWWSEAVWVRTRACVTRKCVWSMSTYYFRFMDFLSPPERSRLAAMAFCIAATSSSGIFVNAALVGAPCSSSAIFITMDPVHAEQGVGWMVIDGHGRGHGYGGPFLRCGHICTGGRKRFGRVLLGECV